MQLITFHKDTSHFVNVMQRDGMLAFDADIAREVGRVENIHNLHLVWRELKEHKIIAPHPQLKGFWAFELAALEFYFTRERWN